MLLRIVGGLLMIESLFMLIPLFTALIYDEPDWIIFTYTAVLTGLCGRLMWCITPVSKRMGTREGFLLTASVWFFFSIFGMLPFVFGSPATNISSGFFEAMSGFTTTGATTLGDISGMSHGMMMWMALMQWLGGMGIVIFTLAVIPALNNAGGMLMFNAEATGITHDKILPRISQTAKALWFIYILLTLVTALLLWAGPMNLFDSICHAFGTISTGGFSSRPGSVEEFSSDYVLIVICIFMLLSSMNYAMLFNAVMGRYKRLVNDDVLKVYLVSILSFTLLFAIGCALRGEVDSWRDLTLYPLFQVVSSISSTGYLAPGFHIWQPFVLSLTFMMMLSGGCAGSTSGGAKIDRLIYLKRYVSNQVRRVIHPNAVLAVTHNGKAVSRDIVDKVIAFLCIFVLLIAAGGTLLSFMGLPAVDSFFSSFSCICNTGFGASLTGYGDDFTSIPDGAKWVLSFLMLTGRLEIYTIVVLFSRSFWK